MLVSWLLFILAIRSISLATAYTLVFGAPLFMTLLSRVFLGEHVSWPRWVAVIGGFLGVLLIFSPASMGFNTAAFIALLAAHGMGGDKPYCPPPQPAGAEYRILFYYMAISVLATGPFAATTWTPIAVAHLPVFLLTGLVGVVAHWLLAQAFRYGEVSLIAPFEYTGLIWAVVLGYWLWGDVPTAEVLSGGGLIIASGIYMIRAERGRRQTEGQEAESESTPTPASSSA